MTIERWTDPKQVPEITRLLHRAYAPLAEQGLRYLASHQDDATTLARLSKGIAYIAIDEGEIVGTVCLSSPGGQDSCELFRRPNICTFHQLAVEPSRQGAGIGGALLDLIEKRALELGANALACDTAEHATDLIAMYERRGFKLAGYEDWEVTNYRSVLLVNTLA